MAEVFERCGHPKTPENAYVRKVGPRKSYAPQCRTCRQIAWKRSVEAKKRLRREGLMGEYVCPECGSDDFMALPGLHRHRAMVHGVLPDHGTRARYVEHGCRCKDCVFAQSRYNRDNKRKLKAARCSAPSQDDAGVRSASSQGAPTDGQSGGQG